MILDLVINLLTGVLTFLTGLFPSWTDPNLGQWAAPAGDCLHVSGACFVGSQLAIFSRWIDLSLLSNVVSIAMASLALAGTIKLLLWVYDKLPFKAA